jgi:hypothetical protein
VNGECGAPVVPERVLEDVVADVSRPAEPASQTKVNKQIDDE